MCFRPCRDPERRWECVTCVFRRSTGTLRSAISVSRPCDWLTRRGVSCKENKKLTSFANSQMDGVEINVWIVCLTLT